MRIILKKKYCENIATAECQLTENNEHKTKCNQSREYKDNELERSVSIHRKIASIKIQSIFR